MLSNNNEACFASDNLLFDKRIENQTRYLTVLEITKRLRMSPHGIYRAIKRGEIPASKIGSVYRLLWVVKKRPTINFNSLDQDAKINALKRFATDYSKLYLIDVDPQKDMEISASDEGSDIRLHLEVNNQNITYGYRIVSENNGKFKVQGCTVICVDALHPLMDSSSPQDKELPIKAQTYSSKKTFRRIPWSCSYAIYDF